MYFLVPWMVWVWEWNTVFLVTRVYTRWRKKCTEGVSPQWPAIVRYPQLETVSGFRQFGQANKTWWNSGYFVNLVVGLILKKRGYIRYTVIHHPCPKDEISVLTVVGIQPSTQEDIYVSKFALDPTHTNSKYLRMYSGTHTTIFSSNARFSIVSKEATFENMATHVVKKNHRQKWWPVGGSNQGPINKKHILPSGKLTYCQWTKSCTIHR